MRMKHPFSSYALKVSNQIHSTPRACEITTILTLILFFWNFLLILRLNRMLWFFKLQNFKTVDCQVSVGLLLASRAHNKLKLSQIVQVRGGAKGFPLLLKIKIKNKKLKTLSCILQLGGSIWPQNWVSCDNNMKILVVPPVEVFRIYHWTPLVHFSIGTSLF